LGAAYAFAFFSLSSQIVGLLGHDGLLPIERFLELVEAQLGQERFGLIPTLFWLNSSDFFLQFLCGAGGLVAILVIVGVFTGPALLICWIFIIDRQCRTRFSLVPVGHPPARDWLSCYLPGALAGIGAALAIRAI